MNYGNSGKNLQLPILQVRGFPFPGFSLYKKENIEAALDYIPRKDDVFIVTYPKSGTTWMTYIIWEILNRGAPLPSMEEMNYRLVPYTEMCGATAINELPDPRVFKYHTTYDLVPKSPDAKYIYLCRNPKDTLVSRFFLYREIYELDIKLGDFLELFLSASLAHGSWFDHVTSWYENRNQRNILFLTYEELSENRCNALFKVAGFLGSEYEELLRKDNGLVETILKQTSFPYMKANLPVAIPVQNGSSETESKFRSINFFRKGMVGDWKNYLSPEQSDKVDECVRSRFSNSDIMNTFL